MNFIKKCKGTILTIGIAAIVLAICFYYPNLQNTSTGDPVNEPVNEDVLAEDHAEIETKETIVPTPVAPSKALESNAEMEVQEKSVAPIPAAPSKASESNAEVETQGKSIAPTPVAPSETMKSSAEMEIQEGSIEKSVLSCTLAVKCDTLLDNLESVASEKIPFIPESGLILPETEFEFSDGESAFDVLERELKKRNIQFEFTMNPMYNSVYIEGIGNLYEFDAGNLSGWMYRVNGTTLSVGCSQYKLKKGDKIEFLYTCNMGRDL